MTECVINDRPKEDKGGHSHAHGGGHGWDDVVVPFYTKNNYKNLLNDFKGFLLKK